MASSRNFVEISGYLFSSDILATMERYSSGVAQCVMEKAKRACEALNGVSFFVDLVMNEGSIGQF